MKRSATPGDQLRIELEDIDRQKISLEDKDALILKKLRTILPNSQVWSELQQDPEYWNAIINSVKRAIRAIAEKKIVHEDDYFDPYEDRDKKIREIFKNFDLFPYRNFEGKLVQPPRGRELSYPLWNTLKRDSAFWREIAKLLDFVSWERGIDESGRPVLEDFTLNDIYSILGYYAEELVGVIPANTLDTAEGKRMAKQIFNDYMQNYDQEAKMNFLILYGRYLVLIGEIRPIRPVDKTTTTTKVDYIPPELQQTKQPVEGSLAKAVNKDYLIITALSLKESKYVDTYFFYMKKGPEPELANQFFITINETTQIIPVNGVITKILKFFYKNRLTNVANIYIVIEGEKDNKMIKIDRANQRNEVIEDFSLSYALYEDVTFIDVDRVEDYSLNMNSVSSIDEIKLMDMKVLSKLGPQKIVKSGDLSAEEKLRLKKERMAKVARGEEYVEFKSSYDYGKLMTNIIQPLGVTFILKTDEVKIGIEKMVVAARLVRIPTAQPDSVFHLAVLVKQYAGLNASDYTYQLLLYRYVLDLTTNTSRASRNCIFLMGKFVDDFPGFTPNEDSQARNMKMVFLTNTYFYIEMTVQSGDNIYTVASPCYHFDAAGDFQLRPLTKRPASNEELLENVPDFQLINTLKGNNYRLYDNRRSFDVRIVLGNKFDYVFYKFDYETGRARFIFYKWSTIAPMVGDVTWKNEKAIVFMPYQAIKFCFAPIGQGFCFLTSDIQNNAKLAILTVSAMEQGKTAKALQDYEVDKFDLSSLGLSLSLIEPMSEHKEEWCFYCGGGIKARRMHQETGDLVCDEVCHVIYNTSMRFLQ